MRWTPNQAASPSLPDDIEVLRAMVMALMAERDAVTSQLDAVTAERDTLLERNERLHHLLLKLKRMQFGTKSERLPEEQLQLGLEAIEQAIAKNEAEAEKRDPALQKGPGCQAPQQRMPPCRRICRGSR